MDVTHDLELMLEAKVPIIAIETQDERRMLELLTKLTIKRNCQSYLWTITRGLRRLSFTAAAPDNGESLTEPEAVLAHILANPGPALYVLCDFHAHMKDAPKVVRYLKDIALDHDSLQNAVLLLGHEVPTPKEISRLTASFELALPSDADLMGIVREVAQEWARRNPQRRVQTDERTLKAFVANLRGLTHADARVLVRHAVFRDGAITESDIPQVNRLKFQLLDSEGPLRLEPNTVDFSAVAGLANLQRWLHDRAHAFLEGHGDDAPRGILLLGVQGSGKSLAARAIAGEWALPLLRLDFGAMYDKYVGETERNVRNALAQAELMAPCVLWIDEIEKGIATDSEHAITQRVLGTLLTWMAEPHASVFIVATANDIARLPPELIRKGRLDEIFFVDLPDQAARKAILEVHLRKRGVDPGSFDLEELALLGQGFTGAELEQAVVSARYRARAAHPGAPLTEVDLSAALTGTYPLSVVMAEQIQSLRDWAKDRTVPA
jgi:SpoVK/Ycf46/Vps4 family AAA+-type ATPase